MLSIIRSSFRKNEINLQAFQVLHSLLEAHLEHLNRKDYKRQDQAKEILPVGIGKWGLAKERWVKCRIYREGDTLTHLLTPQPQILTRVGLPHGALMPVTRVTLFRRECNDAGHPFEGMAWGGTAYWPRGVRKTSGNNCWHEEPACQQLSTSSQCPHTIPPSSLPCHVVPYLCKLYLKIKALHLWWVYHFTKMFLVWSFVITYI